jgi:hypothetical protein
VLATAEKILPPISGQILRFAEPSVLIRAIVLQVIELKRICLTGQDTVSDFAKREFGRNLGHSAHLSAQFDAFRAFSIGG